MQVRLFSKCDNNVVFFTTTKEKHYIVFNPNKDRSEREQYIADAKMEFLFKLMESQQEIYWEQILSEFERLDHLDLYFI